ncbi:MAG: ComEA family DNA-binding protein [Dehalococcoidia bacterium]|nr:ComEA family DNA-binding protein [Dehalococcoidia bacterium]
MRRGGDTGRIYAAPRRPAGGRPAGRRWAVARPDLLAINLAVRLRDEQQVIVPSKTAARPPDDQAPASTPAQAQPPDINSASTAALEALPGIGRVRAAAIVRYREEHGPFPSVEALSAVPGIGPATVASLKGLAVAR